MPETPCHRGKPQQTHQFSVFLPKRNCPKGATKRPPHGLNRPPSRKRKEEKRVKIQGEVSGSPHRHSEGFVPSKKEQSRGKARVAVPSSCLPEHRNNKTAKFQRRTGGPFKIWGVREKQQSPILAARPMVPKDKIGNEPDQGDTQS